MAVRLINREDLTKMMFKEENFKLVDVLPKGHYQEEHIKGAISLPLDEIETEAKKLLNKDDTIVVYCASFECPASTKAAEKLISLGYQNVFDYKGGLKDYKETKLPLEGSSVKECVSCRSCG